MHTVYCLVFIDYSFCKHTTFDHGNIRLITFQNFSLLNVSQILLFLMLWNIIELKIYNSVIKKKIKKQ